MTWSMPLAWLTHRKLSSSQKYISVPKYISMLNPFSKQKTGYGMRAEITLSRISLQ